MKRKGFTLIELLAVIVVLAIIALIATPIVMNVINKAKDSATLRSAERFLNAVDQGIMNETLDSGRNFKPETCKVEGNNVICDDKSINVEVNGERPSRGKITYKDGKVTTVSLGYSTNKVVTKEEDSELKIETISGGYQNYLVQSKYGVNIGDYVNYTFTKAGEYTVEAVNSGYSSDQTRAQVANNSMKWRVLGVDDNGNLELISETSIRSLRFDGAAGYNNGVFLLNELNNVHYSNTTLGATARNLSIEDIEKQFTVETLEARDTFVNREPAVKTYGAGSNYYPNIYVDEMKSGVDGTIREGGISSSDSNYPDVSLLDSGFSVAKNDLLVTRTYYTFSNIQKDALENDIFYDMIFGTGTSYWLSSRYTCLYETKAGFGLYRVRNNILDGITMYNSDNLKEGHDQRAIRPVVTLPENVILVDAGDGTYNIEENFKAKVLCKAVTPTEQPFYNTTTYEMESVVAGVQATTDTPYALGAEYTCDLGDGSRTFYVLKEDGNNVKLIMNKNIGNTIAWASSGDNSKGPVTANAYLASQTTGWSTLAKVGTVELPTRDEMTSVGGKLWTRVNLDNSLGSLYPEGYWTSSNGGGSNTTHAYSVYYTGLSSYNSVKVNDQNGVRPVITISKSNMSL